MHKVCNFYIPCIIGYRVKTPPWFHEHRGSGLDWDKVYGRTQTASPKSNEEFHIPPRRATEDRVIATPSPPLTVAFNKTQNAAISRVTSDQAIQTDHISSRLRVHKPPG